MLTWKFVYKILSDILRLKEKQGLHPPLNLSQKMAERIFGNTPANGMWVKVGGWQLFRFAILLLC